MNRVITALAAAATSITLSVALAGCASGGGATQSTPPTPNSPTTTAAPACTRHSLSPQMGTTGDAAGSQITQILLTNISGAPCRVAGVPTLLGVRSDGTTQMLGYRGSSDAAVVLQPPGGPGTLQPGAHAQINVTVQLNNCPTPNSPDPKYVRLAIQLDSQTTVDMPFPSVLAGSGCAGSVSQIGRANN